MWHDAEEMSIRLTGDEDISVRRFNRLIFVGRRSAHTPFIVNQGMTKNVIPIV
jgi:hypothetical protein